MYAARVECMFVCAFESMRVPAEDLSALLWDFKTRPHWLSLSLLLHGAASVCHSSDCYGENDFFPLLPFPSFIAAFFYLMS